MKRVFLSFWRALPSVFPGLFPRFLNPGDSFCIDEPYPWITLMEKPRTGFGFNFLGLLHLKGVGTTEIEKMSIGGRKDVGRKPTCGAGAFSFSFFFLFFYILFSQFSGFGCEDGVK